MSTHKYICRDWDVCHSIFLQYIFSLISYRKAKKKNKVVHTHYVAFVIIFASTFLFFHLLEYKLLDSQNILPFHFIHNTRANGERESFVGNDNFINDICFPLFCSSSLYTFVYYNFVYIQIVHGNR